MSFADRLELVREEIPGRHPRWCIKWSNLGRRNDLFIVNFNTVVPQETAEAVYALLKQDKHLQRILK